MEKSTWASYSRTPMPKRVADSEDDDFPDGKNNVLNITVNSGDKNVVAVEVAVRKSVGSVYGDYQLMGLYNKKEMNIADNTPFTVNFYNDSVYPPLDQREIDLLFDYHPLKAESQVVVNGNVLAYGDITEGYNKIAENELVVGFSTENIEHGQEVFATGEIEMLFNDYFFIEVGIQGAVVPGSKYIIRVAGVDFGEKEASYIAEPGDTIDDIARELSEAFPSDEYAYVSSQVANYFLVHVTGSGFYATF